MARPAPASRGFTLVEILVVIAIMSALIAMVASAVSRAGPAKNRLVCMNNLRQMGGLLAAASLEGRTRAIPGAGYLLQLRARGEVLEGDERVFFCPQDPAFEETGKPGLSARYARLDLERPPEGLCSYRVRDFRRFPVRPDSPRREPVAVCPHHADGVAVLYADGTAAFLGREALGLRPEDAVVIGPSSPVEFLRMFPEPAR